MGSRVRVETYLRYTVAEPCRLLLQIEAAEGGAQRCVDASLTVDPAIAWTIVLGEEGIGLRRWGVVQQRFDCTYSATVEVTRAAVDMPSLRQVALEHLPSDVIKFLMPSRYCLPEDHIAFVAGQFGTLSGGALIAAMSDWIKTNFTYDIFSSDGATTATDSFRDRRGVCRDYAHVLIAMARSVGIPARFVSAYAPDVTPQDIHAVVEVFLDGAWHLIDPTGMATAPDIVRIGVGRDAADVSFMTSFGWMELKKQTVTVSRID